MRISVFGLGYVGAVTGACLAKRGHEVVGVDPDPIKLRYISEGRGPILEEGLDPLMSEVVSAGKLRVTADSAEAVAETDASIICVGTPSADDGSLHTGYIERAAREVASGIRAKGDYHSVIVRSTVIPGTTQNLLLPLLEAETGGPVGTAFGVSTNPEFLREGVAIDDFHDPPFTVIGTEQREEFDRIAEMYAGLPGEKIHCSTAAAEAIKYSCNIYHAVKITMANEIGLLCERLGVDARQVMDAICADTKLNVSARYLRPGFAFGGSCLPKDLRAFTSAARRSGVMLPMLEAVLPSNRHQIDEAVRRILKIGSRKIALLGLAFKEGTDDLRESPLVALAEALVGKGIDLKILDPNVKYAALYGSNKEFIDRELPHLKRALCPPEEILEQADVLVIGHKSPVCGGVLAAASERHTVVDLVGYERPADFQGQFIGLYW